MADAQYYMRVRGQVQGPYDQEKLQRMSRRGQLSRLYEVSTDGVNWARASTYPELFVGPAMEPIVAPPRHTAAPAPPTLAPFSQPGSLDVVAPPSAAPPQAQWWYSIQGTKHGPIDFGALQQLTGTSQLRANDFVWKSGMPDWVSVAEVSDLAIADGQWPNDARQIAELPESLCKAALHLRSWALLLAIAVCVSTGLLCSWGLWQFFGVAAEGASAAWTLLAGALALVESGILAAVAILLSIHASRLAGLRHSRQPVVLEKALATLRHFWILATIALLLAMVLIALFLATLPAGELAPAAGV